MPRLPTADDLNLALPTPSRAVVGVAPPRRAPGDDYGARLFANIAKMAEEEADRLDDIAAEDALNRLRDRRLALTYDPSEGFMNVQGGDVTRRPVLDEYSTKFTKSIEGLEKELNSPRAKQRFRQRADGEFTAFRGDLYRHVGQQIDKYTAATLTATFGNLAAEVRAASGDPAVLNRAIGAANETIAKAVKYYGLSGETLEMYRREKLGALHSAMIEGLLETGRAKEAEDYFKTAAKDGALTEQQIAAMAPRIKSRVDWEIGSEAANSGMEVFLRTRDMHAAVKEVEKLTKGNEGAHKGGIALLKEQIAAQQNKEREIAGSLYARFEISPTAATAAAIYATPEFTDALPMTEQAALRKYIRSELEQAEDRARQREQDKLNDPDALRLFGEFMSDPDSLARASEEALFYYRPLLGKHLLNRLLGERKAIIAGNRRLGIDPQILNEAIPKALLSPQNKDKLNHFKGVVERNLAEYREQHPGAVEIPAQVQKEIVARASKEYTQPGLLFGTNKVPAYNLKPMPSEFEHAAQAEAKRRGLPPLTYDQLLALWAQQKESRR